VSPFTRNVNKKEQIMIRPLLFIPAAAAVLILVLGGTAGADPVWLCCLTEAVACEEAGDTGPVDLGGLERPTFLRVDSGVGHITLLAPASRAGEVTRIDVAHEGDDRWVFSGVEEDRAWSMVIAATGHMTLSVTGDGATWSVFGHALVERE
jgi:hypothetical protein